MDRRTFLESVAGAAVVGEIVKLPLPLGERVRKPFARAQWVQNGIIDAGGSHEPYTFVVRRGGAPLDARWHYEHAQSEDVIRTLHEQGVEVFHTHLYKGFGMAAESAEMEDARKACAIAHRYGMKVDTYVQWGSLMYETFFVEEPRARDWVQRDSSGRPIMLDYGYQQSFRYRPCYTHQEYLDYLKKVVRFAVEEVKSDFLHFDNFDYNAEPDSCHCLACVECFRTFLKAKYTPSERQERFGFENVDYVNPPVWNRQNPPEKMAIIFDPIFQEWIDFRCQVIAEGLRQLAEYARSLNPDVAIEINPMGITGENRAWQSGIDHPRLLTSTNVYWTEEDNPCGFTSDGRLISKIRSYKLARAFHNVLFAVTSDNTVAMAEALAFNQTPGFVGGAPLPPEVLRYVLFYRKNRELFLQAEDVGPVGILRSYASITYHHSRAQLTTILVEQALIQSRLPFQLIFDEPMPDLKKLQVLVLPDSECLSDLQLTQIRSYVEQGGGLVAIGAAGLYDEWRRLRTEPGLKGLVDNQPPARSYEEQVEETAAAGSVQRKTLGKGRVAYLPSALFDGPLPMPEPFFAISNRFWRRPRNWEEITSAIRWAAKVDLPFEVSGPADYLAANFVEQSERHCRLIHLVNYDAQRTPAIAGVRCVVQIPPEQNAREVTMYQVEAESPRSLPFASGPSHVTFTAPDMKTYALIRINW